MKSTFESVLEKILDDMKLNRPYTMNQIAEMIGVNWSTAKRAVDILFDIQDFFAAYEILVLGERPKMVLIQPRIRMSQLPSDVIDWFITSSFFTTPKQSHESDEARTLIVERVVESRTPINIAIDRIIRSLKLEDELSILEMSRRTELNRRTVDRLLDLLVHHQDKISQFRFVEMDGAILKEPRPDLYELDSPMIKLLLTKYYLPDESPDIPEEKERELLRLS
ncbi:MAG: hypothetical protein GF411_19685 [Candidatus Lokiarchaeota archaeon]|nr:hypothetical protein [Candidatus Lokiarchaeota archaeon]